MLDASAFVDIFRFVHIYRLPSTQMIGQTVEGKKTVLAPTVMMFNTDDFSDSLSSYVRSVAVKASRISGKYNHHLHIACGDPVAVDQRTALSLCVFVTSTSEIVVGRTPVYTFSHGVQFEDKALEVVSTTHRAH
jgi:hypothetical protein